jgi:hypothetical protein
MVIIIIIIIIIISYIPEVQKYPWQYTFLWVG